MIVISVFGMIAVFFACISQRKKVIRIGTSGNIQQYKYDSFSHIYFALSFVILATVCFVSGNGIDMYAYIRYYEIWTIRDIADPSIEPGYKLLTLFLRSFIPNPYVGLGIIKVVSIYLVYRALYVSREKINLGMSVLAYVALLYIYNFHLLRMMLALGMVFLALANELAGKSKKAIIMLIAAVFFHYTSIIVLLTYVIYRFLGNRLTTFKIMLFLLALMLIYMNIVQIFQNLVSSINIFDKYTTYLNRANSSIGVVQFILFIPVIYLLVSTYRYKGKDDFYNLNMVVGIMLFFAGSLGYLVPVASRTVFYFYFFAVVYMAATPLVGNRISFKLKTLSINSNVVMSFIYLVMQVVITYILNEAAVTNGLTQYSFWW